MSQENDRPTLDDVALPGVISYTVKRLIERQEELAAMRPQTPPISLELAAVNNAINSAFWFIGVVQFLGAQQLLSSIADPSNYPRGD